MIEEPQPTTHNAERGAHSMCRERSETGSFPQKTEQNVCCSLIGEISWRFGEKSLVIWRNPFGEIRWRFGETWSAIWRNLFGENIGDLEKHGRRFGETCSAKTLEIWRNVVGAVVAISYWSSLWRSLELGDCKWRLNHSGETMETNYGNKNFIHHGAENIYLECFMDRNV